jgi:hypothetical protein
MAQAENKKLVESLYDAFARGDLQYILERVTDDVEWVNEGPKSIPYAGKFSGRAGGAAIFRGVKFGGGRKGHGTGAHCGGRSGGWSGTLHGNSEGNR